MSENPNFRRATSRPPSPSQNWLGAPGALVARASRQAFGFTAPLLPALPMTLALALWTGRWSWIGRMLAAGLLVITGSLAMAWGNWPLSGPAAGPGGTLGAFLSLRVADVPIRWVDLGTWLLMCLGMVALIGPSLPIWILEGVGNLLLLAPTRQATGTKAPAARLTEVEPDPLPVPAAPEFAVIEPWQLETGVVKEPVAKVEQPKKVTDGIPIHHHASRSADSAVDNKPKRPPAAVPEFAGYEVPGLDILDDPEPFQVDRHEELLRERAILLEQAFRDYGIHVKVVGINTGPVITQFEISLETGLRLNKVTRLAEDIALNLRVPSVRMVAPIPGKNTVGVEIPNELRATVRLKEVMQVAGRKLDTMKIPLIRGKDNEGRALVHDLADMPHLLIAG
ncbi:MAG: DNA translocase FtsK 4TM domain-containing protein, partial [Gemmataceae bacterium]